MHTRKYLMILLAVVWLSLGAMACSLGGLIGGGAAAKVPQRQVPISTEAATEAKQALDDATAKGGTVRLSEAQFSSFLNEGIRQNTTEEDAVTDITVWFDPGKITLRANVSQKDLPVKGEMIISGQLKVIDGKLNMDIEQASIGGVPVPNSVLKLLSSQINAAMSDTSQSEMPLKKVTLETGNIVLEFEPPAK